MELTQGQRKGLVLALTVVLLSDVSATYRTWQARRYAHGTTKEAIGDRGISVGPPARVHISFCNE